MGRLTYETYDPYDLEFPNDTDFELEGVDEAYAQCQEYISYLPDRIAQLQSLDAQAVNACQNASNAIATACSRLASSSTGNAMAQLLVDLEAVSTVRVEGYLATCMSMFDYRAALSSGRAFPNSEMEDVALDAVYALQDFVIAANGRTVTVEELCDANGLLTRSSSCADMCGELRERPVFIGRSLFDAEFVPPPADTLDDYLDDLVRFINYGSGTNSVAKAALAHAQFVVIHPFEDGNGRVGRALAQRVLCTEGTADSLILPSTAVMAARKQGYIDALRCMQSSSGPSDPSRAVEFFANCCERAAHRVLAMEQHVKTILTRWLHAMPEASEATKKAVGMFIATPVMSRAMLSSALPVDVDVILDAMLRTGILRKYRSAFCGIDLYAATDILDMLEDMW